MFHKTKNDLTFTGFLSLLDTLRRDGLTNDFWIFIGILFGDSLISATRELIDNVKADKYTSDLRKNVLWRIKSSSQSNFYYIYFNGVENFFCTCFQFRERCVKDGSCLLCKHALYVFICNALEGEEGASAFMDAHTVSEDEFSHLLENSLSETVQETGVRR